MVKQLNKWEKLFIEFLNMTEFSLQRRVDFDDVDCYGVEDYQHANLGGIEQDFFYSAADVLDRMEVYEHDYIINDLEECLLENNVSCEYNEWFELLQYRPLLPNNQADFDFIEMICYHPQDIDINHIYSYLQAA